MNQNWRTLLQHARKRSSTRARTKSGACRSGRRLKN